MLSIQESELRCGIVSLSAVEDPEGGGGRSRPEKNDNISDEIWFRMRHLRPSILKNYWEKHGPL